MMDDFSLEAYQYDLPEELIAQKPVSERDTSRLLALNRSTGSISHLSFTDFPKLLSPGDCLVLNDTKVFPARLLGRKVTGGKVEIFLLHYPYIHDEYSGSAKALVKASKRLRPGQKILFNENFWAVVEELSPKGEITIKLQSTNRSIVSTLEDFGRVPLPPYIRREPKAEDKLRYQTIYAKEQGSVAAPTAGLHFTKKILEKIKKLGVKICTITLHVGYGTFAPIRENDIRNHKIHSEWIQITQENADKINSTKQDGGRVICVGTTSVRAVEFAANSHGHVREMEGECDLYICPGYKFKIVDSILTNFHLPGSSLLVLVAAFAGRDTILKAYSEAISKGYRFYSYGDAMFIF